MYIGDAESSKKCGEIVVIELNVEDALDHFTSAYCGFSGVYEEIINGMRVTQQTLATKENIHRINYLIQPRLSFSQKIDIFEEICKAEKIDGAAHNTIVKKIRNIQKIRNNVAHGERIFTLSMKTKLRTKRGKYLPLEEFYQSLFDEEERSGVELTDELLKELDSDQKAIIGYLPPVANKILLRRIQNWKNSREKREYSGE